MIHAGNTRKWLKRIPWLLMIWFAVFSHYPINPKLETLAAPKGNLELARDLLEGSLHKLALPHLIPVALDGNAEAQYLLGEEYDHHTLDDLYPLNTNVCSATYWYDKSARQGYPPAQYAMYMAYYDYGAGIRPDIKKAYRWLRTAEKNGLRINNSVFLEIEAELDVEDMNAIRHELSTWDPRQEPPATIYWLPYVSGFSEWWVPLTGIMPCGHRVSWFF